MVFQGRLHQNWRSGFFVSHLSYTNRFKVQCQAIVKVHGVFPSSRGYTASSPDLDPVRHLPKASLPLSLDFIIVQDILLTETAQLANVVLPAVTFAEKDGSMTNVDHHIQAIRKALRPLSGAKADWEILTTLARHMGEQWTYASPRDIFLEIADTNPFYAGLTWEDLGLQGIRTQEQEVDHV